MVLGEGLLILNILHDFTIVPLFPKYEVLRVMQGFKHPPDEVNVGSILGDSIRIVIGILWFTLL